MKKWIMQYKSEIKLIIWLFIISRIVLSVIGIFSRVLLEPIFENVYVWQYSKILFLDIWGIHDSGWYLNISHNWYPYYQNFDLEILGQTSFNFFPLYPFLTKIFGIILFNNFFIAGLLVSNFFLIVAAFYLYRLSKIEYKQSIARRSVIYLFLAPASFVLSGVFTESLFLAFVNP